MLEATLTSKGQTTIPKEVRDELHLVAGDRLTFTRIADGAVLLRAKTVSLLDLGGSLQGDNQPKIDAGNMSPFDARD